MKKYIYHTFLLISLLCCAIARPAAAYQSSGTYHASNAYMLATIIWHEIGSGSEADMQQVANVVMNRYELYRSGAGGSNVQIGDILTAPAAFSGSERYLNANMTDADILKHIDGRMGRDAWEKCLKIANLALNGQLKDITQGATHYRTCNRQTGAHTTFWGSSALNLEHNGPHCFFKDIKMGALKINGKTIAREGKITGQFSGSYTGSTVGGGGGAYGGGGGGMAYDSGGFTDFTLTDEQYKSACVSAKTEDNSGSYSTPPNLFNTKILSGIEAMMKKIYLSLGILYALGQGLMCYATDIGYYCIGLTVFGFEACVIKLVNLQFWLCGAAIYITAFFLSMSIGMYFIDVSFKIGFAMLMLPISIALWPFEPTRGKLSENLSIIIRNAMLFALVSIGVSFAIILIEQGILHGIDETTLNTALAEKSGKKLTETFALDTMNALVIVFCLIFGLKIVTSSVNDYLNKLFPDNLFGGSSPMHHMGTQAVGNIQARTVAPAAALVRDMAKNGAGHLMMGVGKGLTDMSRGDFTPLRNIASFGAKIGHKISHPREIRQDAVRLAGRGLQNFSSGVAALDRELTDVGRLIKPGLYSEEERQAEKLEYDNNSRRRENAANEFISAGTEGLNYVLDKAEDYTAIGVKAGARGIKNAAMAGAAAVASTKAGQTVISAGQSIAHSASEVTNEIKEFGQEAAALYQTVEEETKDTVAGAAAAVANTFSDEEIGSEEMRGKMHDVKENIKSTVKGWGKAAVAGVKDGAVNYDKGSYSLTPGNILSNAVGITKIPFKKETYRQLAKLPELYKKRMSTEEILRKKEDDANRAQEQKQADDKVLPNATATQRLIMKTTRGATRIFVRTGVDTLQTTTAVTGSLLQKFGKKLTQNKPRGGNYWREYLKEKERQEKIQKLKEQDQRETDATLADQFEERR